jgi:hypothetical protein
LRQSIAHFFDGNPLPLQVGMGVVQRHADVTVTHCKPTPPPRPDSEEHPDVATGLRLI